MSTKPIRLLATLAAAALAGCIMPPSMFERWNLEQSSQPWQQQGRYRPSSEGAPAAPEPPQPVERRAPNRAPESPNTSLENPAETTAPLPTATEPPPYAWDGGVVDGAPQGRVVAQAGTPRGLPEPSAGRTHIIELYQQVLDERDALAARADQLSKNLEESNLALAAKTKEAEELTAHVASLEAAHADLLEQNQTLGARLVQAQIRRLEAEKLLLESHLEAERTKAAETARAAAAVGRPNGAPKTPAKPAGGEHE